MKRLLMLLMLCVVPFTLTSCATSKPTTVTTTDSQLANVQANAVSYVAGLGIILQEAPSALTKAYGAGLITKESFNAAVDVYNRALSSYILLNKSLQAVIKANQNPMLTDDYITSLATFLTDQKNLDALTGALGGK